MVKVGREKGTTEDTGVTHPTVYAAGDVEQQNELQQNALQIGVTGNASVSPETDGAGSLDEDWTRLFLEPMLPDFANDIFIT